MWVEFMTVRNAYVAEVWRELFAAEGLSVQVIPPVNRGESATLRYTRAESRAGLRPT